MIEQSRRIITAEDAEGKSYVVNNAEPGKIIVDLARVVDTPPEGVEYHGINW